MNALLTVYNSLEIISILLRKDSALFLKAGGEEMASVTLFSHEKVEMCKHKEINAQLY